MKRSIARRIMYVIVDSNDKFYGATKDFTRAVEIVDKYEKKYGERFYISTTTDFDLTDEERWVRK